MEIVSIDAPLPVVIDDAAPWLPPDIRADLVLDFLRHPDLSHALAEKCRQANIPVVASGRKGRLEGVRTPPTCCALRRHESLGTYGRCFGMPEFQVATHNGKIEHLTVIRGAPCGATWEAAQRVIGLPTVEAAVRIGLETQFFCVADPSGWDPIGGKSPVHIAGELHKAALVRALNTKRSCP